MDINYLHVALTVAILYKCVHLLVMFDMVVLQFHYEL